MFALTQGSIIPMGQYLKVKFYPESKKERKQRLQKANVKLAYRIALVLFLIVLILLALLIYF